MIALPRAWIRLDLKESAEFVREFRREAPRSHELYGTVESAIARHNKWDEFLFCLKDGRVAQIHLTWSVESKPDWPGYEVFTDLDAWLAHAGYNVPISENDNER